MDTVGKVQFHELTEIARADLNTLNADLLSAAVLIGIGLYLLVKSDKTIERIRQAVGDG